MSDKMNPSDETKHQPEKLIQDFVEKYVHRFIAQSEMDGKSEEQIQQSMDLVSFILVVKMLRKEYGKNLPKGEKLVIDLAHIMEGTPDNVYPILHGFIRSGWMDHDYELTELGVALTPKA